MSSGKTDRRKERTKRDVFLRPSFVLKLVTREGKKKDIIISFSWST
jgi:hypothetical protein